MIYAQQRTTPPPAAASIGRYYSEERTSEVSSTAAADRAVTAAAAATAVVVAAAEAANDDDALPPPPTAGTPSSRPLVHPPHPRRTPERRSLSPELGVCRSPSTVPGTSPARESHVLRPTAPDQRAGVGSSSQCGGGCSAHSAPLSPRPGNGGSPIIDIVRNDGACDERQIISQLRQTFVNDLGWAEAAAAGSSPAHRMAQTPGAAAVAAATNAATADDAAAAGNGDGAKPAALSNLLSKALEIETAQQQNAARVSRQLVVAYQQQVHPVGHSAP